MLCGVEGQDFDMNQIQPEEIDDINKPQNNSNHQTHMNSGRHSLGLMHTAGSSMQGSEQKLKPTNKQQTRYEAEDEDEIYDFKDFDDIKDN